MDVGQSNFIESLSARLKKMVKLGPRDQSPWFHGRNVLVTFCPDWKMEFSEETVRKLPFKTKSKPPLLGLGHLYCLFLLLAF